jgi:solute carrier family 25, member 39/40
VILDNLPTTGVALFVLITRKIGHLAVPRIAQSLQVAFWGTSPQRTLKIRFSESASTLCLSSLFFVSNITCVLQQHRITMSPPSANEPLVASSTTSDSSGGRYKGVAWAKVVSAAVGSTVTALAVTPLEVVKVRQQAAGGGHTEASSTTATFTINKNLSLPKNVTTCRRGCGTFVLNTGLGEYLTPKSKCRYFDPMTGRLRQDQAIAQSHGTLRMIRSIFLKEGFGGIYAGLAPTLVMGVPNTIIYFYSYEELSARLLEEYPTEPMVPAIAGASARFVASLSTAPFELLRTRQAARVGVFVASNTNNVGMVGEFRSMIRSDGVSSLFRGVWPTLLRDVPFSAVYWVCIESMRDSWKRQRNENTAESNVSPWQQAGEALINGFVSGTIAAAVTTPLDVLKTRSQVEVSQSTLSSSVAAEASLCDHGGSLAYHPPKSSASVRPSSSISMLTMARGIVEEEGVAGLWRGNIARMMKVAPACAIMISSYEVGKRVMIEQSQR